MVRELASKRLATRAVHAGERVRPDEEKTHGLFRFCGLTASFRFPRRSTVRRPFFTTGSKRLTRSPAVSAAASPIRVTTIRRAPRWRLL